MSFQQWFRRSAGFLLGSSAQFTRGSQSKGFPILRTLTSKALNDAAKSNFTLLSSLAGVVVGGVGGYWYWSKASDGNVAWTKRKCDIQDYQKVYNSIAEVLDGDHDDGSYGPVIVRLAWHAAGTYDKTVGDGGSYRATMRMDPEASHAGNVGLGIGRERLEPIKQKYPWISYGDLWTLAAVCAVQEMGGPTIPWKPGRVDGVAADSPPDGRLPNPTSPNPQDVKNTFYRMGFNDQEIVALIGAHTLGRCHKNVSGFDGPWTNSPTSFTNSFFVELLGRKWVEKKWDGPKQYEDKESRQLMMLPADLAFLCDTEFKKWVEVYSKDEKKYFEDFAKVWQKMLELGVPFQGDTPEYTFKTTG